MRSVLAAVQKSATRDDKQAAAANTRVQYHTVVGGWPTNRALRAGPRVGGLVSPERRDFPRRSHNNSRAEMIVGRSAVDPAAQQSCKTADTQEVPKLLLNIHYDGQVAALHC